MARAKNYSIVFVRPDGSMVRTDEQLFYTEKAARAAARKRVNGSYIILRFFGEAEVVSDNNVLSSEENIQAAVTVEAAAAIESPLPQDFITSPLDNATATTSDTFPTVDFIESDEIF